MSDTPQAQPEAGRDKLEIDMMFLCGSTFTRVSLKDAEFRDTHMMNALIDDVNATGIRFNNVNLSDAVIEEVNLTGASIQFANLSDMAISDVNITGMTLNGVLLSDMVALWDKTHGGGGAEQ
jgi:uncharacterized protein YjbI with pentapeptide repeats